MLLNLEEAAATSNYTPAHIKYLARRGIIPVSNANGAPSYSAQHLNLYGKVPKGYTSFEDGAEHYSYSKEHLRRLVRRLGIPTIKVLRTGYFSAEEFERALQVRAGYVRLDAAAEYSMFERDTLRKLVSNKKIDGIKWFNMWHVNTSSLSRYERSYRVKRQKGKVRFPNHNKGMSGASLESRVGSD